MRRSAVLCSALILFACSPADDEAAESTTVIPEAAAPAAPTLAAFSGTWDMQAMGMDSDSVLTTYRLWAGEDTTGWKMKFDHQADTLPLHNVRLDGDSVIAVIGPYASALRKGVMVTTNTTYRLQDSELVANSVAHYSVTTADSVVYVRARGRRTQ
jgi:hypothetical protein